MSYRQLNAEERTLIAQGLTQGLSQGEIARRLGRPALVRYVARKLAQGWSPQIIAGRIRRAYPRARHRRVSTETIYRWIYRDQQHGGSLWQWLYSRRRRRHPQVRYGSGRRHQIAGRVGIEQRQGIVATRGRFGDWEGDSVLGRAGKSAIASRVERKSRWLSAVRLKDRGALSWSAQAIAGFRRLPASSKRLIIGHASVLTTRPRTRSSSTPNALHLECESTDGEVTGSGLNTVRLRPFDRAGPAVRCSRLEVTRICKARLENPKCALYEPYEQYWVRSCFLHVQMRKLSGSTV